MLTAILHATASGIIHRQFILQKSSIMQMRVRVMESVCRVTEVISIIFFLFILLYNISLTTRFCVVKRRTATVAGS